MVEPEKPLKKKDQITLDEELTLRLQAEKQAELEKERVAQEEANKAAIIEELDSIQAMIDADEQLAVRLQAKEQEQFSIEKSQESGDKLEYDKSKKQKIDEHVEAEKDDLYLEESL
ncbi:hypothetical protein Tco_1238915 [Tanacetum coccineum]